MKTQETATFQLTEYLEKFTHLVQRYDGTPLHSSELEMIIDHYSKFVTNENNIDVWERLDKDEPNTRGPCSLISDLRKTSAACVAIMEKYRALKLLNGHADITDYFKNIESCIEEEFGSFRLTADSKVLMIGSGSFPMTPLVIDNRTGAEVVGIDIDDEAIELGCRVVDRLGKGLNITLLKALVEELEFTKEATHVIFSSTIENKYDMLDQLHPLTSEDVVVAMRYGDRLKSLFNYPMREVDAQKWSLAQTVLRPNHVFDIALYTKA